MHLTQFVLGMKDEDGLSLRPTFGDCRSMPTSRTTLEAFRMPNILEKGSRCKTD
jgi:hypothetical protein